MLVNQTETYNWEIGDILKEINYVGSATYTYVYVLFIKFFG